MNKHTLNLPVDLDFRLLAITAAIKSYVLCYHLNSVLTLQLARTRADHELHTGQAGMPVKYFALYEFHRPDFEQSIYLVQNRNSNGVLMANLPQFDYFMLFYGYFDQEELDSVITALNRLPQVQAAAMLNPANIKNAQNLIVEN